MSGLRRGSAPSNENLDRARVSEGLITESRIESANRFFRPEPARCDNVVFRRLNGRLCGELGGGPMFQVKVDAFSFSLSSSGDTEGSYWPPSKLCSKMLKSMLEALCKLLRLLLRGLPRLAASRFMTPSLRFSGLDFMGDACSRSKGCRNFSGPGFEKSSLMASMDGAVFTESSEQSIFS